MGDVVKKCEKYECEEVQLKQQGSAIYWNGLAAEESAEEWARFFRFYMYSHLVVFFAEKEDMVTEYESYHFIEFEHGIYASYKKSSEGIELIEILNDNLYAITFDGMILIEHFQEIVQI